MSWKAEVIADLTDTWTGNGLTFATQVEAEDYVSDLAWRWTLVRKTRVVESTSPVNYKWEDNKAIPLPEEDPKVIATRHGWRLDPDGAFRNDDELLEDGSPASFWYNGDWDKLCSEASLG